MPNNYDMYHTMYNIYGNITFHGNEIDWKKIDSTNISEGDEYNLTYSYKNESNAIGVYNINDIGDLFISSTEIYAFEPYATIQTPKQLAIKSFGVARPSVPSGLEEIMKNGGVEKNVNIYRTYDGVNISVETYCKVAIYTIDGRLVNIINAV